MSDLGRLDTGKEASSCASAASGQPSTNPQSKFTARRPEPRSARPGISQYARQVATPAEGSQVSGLTNIAKLQSRGVTGRASLVKQQHTISIDPASSQSCRETAPQRIGYRQYNYSTVSFRPENVAPAVGQATPTSRGQEHHQRPDLSAVSENQGLCSSEIGRQSSRSKRRRQARIQTAADPLSVAKTGEQFRPNPRQTAEKVPAGRNPFDRERAHNSKIGIGIEAEFLLSARQLRHKAKTIEEFGRIAAANHNDCVASRHPKMSKYVLPYSSERAVLDQWALSVDPTISRRYEPCKSFPRQRSATWCLHRHS